MKTHQATPVLRYSRSYAVDDDAPEAVMETTKPVSKLNEAVTWGVLGICLAGWSVIGLFLWIPRVMRAVLLFSVALVQSTVAETNAEPAGRRLRSAANFYRRGFVGAVESIRLPRRKHEEDREEDSDADWSIESGLIIRETAWAIVVWYMVLWSTGLVQGTPVDLAAVPWSDMWSGAVEAVASIPELFRG